MIRQAVLLHFTWLHALPGILNDDELKPGLSGDAVFLTRDQNHIYTRPEFRRDAVLVLDRDRITHHHRLVPDHGDIRHPKTQRDRDKWKVQGLTFTSADVAVYRAHGRESEERIYGRLRCLRSFLMEIVIHAEPRDAAAWERDGNAILAACVRHGIPVRRIAYAYRSAWLHPIPPCHAARGPVHRQRSCRPDRHP